MKKSEDNPIVHKSFAFALRTVKLYKVLVSERKELVLSKQLLRSGTSIGANVKEAIRGQSLSDFRAKLNISLKEASESEYWLELLHQSGYIDQNEFDSMITDCREILRILIAIIRTSGKNQM